MGALTLSVTARSVPVFSLVDGNVGWVRCRDESLHIINIIIHKALPRRVIYMH